MLTMRIRACVTPADIQGILAKAGGNIDNVAEQIEGFKKLDDDTQARVLKVLKAGHLDESEKVMGDFIVIFLLRKSLTFGSAGS